MIGFLRRFENPSSAAPLPQHDFLLKRRCLLLSFISSFPCLFSPSYWLPPLLLPSCFLFVSPDLFSFEMLANLFFVSFFAAASSNPPLSFSHHLHQGWARAEFLLKIHTPDAWTYLKPDILKKHCTLYFFSMETVQWLRICVGSKHKKCFYHFS